jgi:hypothetical protein
MNERIPQAKVFAPSWLSLLFCLFIALALCAWVVLSLVFKSSGVSQLILHPNGMGHTQQSILTLPGQAAPESANSLQNTWPLIVFWGFVGLIVYFVVDLFLNLASDIGRFNRELDYVHARRDIIIKTTTEILIVRLVAVVLWLFFVDFFIKRVIPHCINLCDNSTHAISLIHAAEDVLVAFIIMFVCMHINTVFLRIVLRRARIIRSN